MQFINMFEIIFIVSLGITFVLIVLMVYYFKKRIHTIETKCDTMFEIINDIVGELENTKPNNDISPELLFDPSKILQNNFPFNNNIVFSKIPVVLSDNESTDEPIELEYNADIDNNVINSDSDGVSINDSDSDVESEVDSDVESEVDSDSENIVSNPSFKDNSLDETKINNEISNDLENTKTIEVFQNISSTNLDYSKMKLSDLRKLVINKGLTNDAQKLKKNELLKLLEN